MVGLATYYLVHGFSPITMQISPYNVWHSSIVIYIVVTCILLGNEDFRVSKREVDMVPNCTNYLDINYSIILGTVLPSALLITVTFISVGVCYKRRHALHNRNITKSGITQKIATNIIGPNDDNLHRYLKQYYRW